jgi:hypothetical protein
MSDTSAKRHLIEQAMAETAYQKKAVSRLAAPEVLDLAIAWFKEQGYRSARTGRPNQIFILGGPEGILPRVTGEIQARADVGRPGVTLITMDCFGERLSSVMESFHQHLRAQRRTSSAS